MNRRTLGIKTLKYPAWFTALFFILTIVIPISLVVMEGIKVPNTWFRLSFVTVSLAVITWFIIKKYVVDKARTKMLAKQTALEHDYSIDNGNPVKIKYLWFENEQRLTLFEAISILLNGGLLVLVLMGVASTFMKIRLALSIIMILYIIAYTIKFMIIMTMKGEEYEETNG